MALQKRHCGEGKMKNHNLYFGWWRHQPIEKGPVLTPGTRTNANYPTISNIIFTPFGAIPVPYTY
jgi:hypothetical protein